MKPNKFQNEYFFKHPRTPSQQTYCESLQNNVITIGSGPPGTGKTLLALQEAIKQNYRKIYYVRNNCFTDGLGSKGRGELPGTILEKAMPLLGPIADNLFELVAEHKAKYMIEKGIIEPLYYEDLRGRSLANAFIIADEAQNVPSKGIKTLLSRLGRDSKLVLSGDSRQKDTKPDINDGLADACKRLDTLNFVGIVHFTCADIQRNAFLQSILNRYDEY